MRIISLIAIFTLATGVCADVTPSSSGVAEATSLQIRILRGEAHAHEEEFSRQLLIDRRPRRPASSGGNGNSDTGGDSGGAPADGYQAPVRERRTAAPSTENGDGADSVPEQPTPGRQPLVPSPGERPRMNLFNRYHENNLGKPPRL